MKMKNRTMTFTLNRDNALQRENVERLGAVQNEIYASALNFKETLMEKNSESGFMYVVQGMTDQIKQTGERILDEIKMVIELQTEQPKGKIDSIPPIWNHLNEYLVTLFDEADYFLELRDQFIVIVVDIRCRSQQLKIPHSYLKKLKNITKNEEELKIDDNDIEDKVFGELNKIRAILPGHKHFESIIDKKKMKEVNECITKLNQTTKDFQQEHNERRESIESKKEELATKRYRLEAKKARFDQANEEENYNLAKTLHESCTEMMEDYNKFAAIIETDVADLNKLTKDFENVKKPYSDALDAKRKEHDALVLELEMTRKLLGIKGDNLISDFLKKMDNFKQLCMKISARNIQSEEMIRTLSDLLKLGVGDNEENDSPKLKWYFAQPQIALSDFVKPLKKKSIRVIDDFRREYKGKLNKFKTELLPYLEKQIQRKIKPFEERKLKHICKANV